MDGQERIAGSLGGSAQVLAAMAADRALCAAAAAAAGLAAEALRQGGRLLICGNGGSAADAQHWAAELVGRFQAERPGLAAIALTTDSSALTAIGNDYGFERVFARQVEALGREGDVLFAISTSGRSANVLAAAEAARAIGMRVVGFTGASRGPLDALCAVTLHVPSGVTARIQEGHAALGHAICGAVEAALFPPGAPSTASTPDTSPTGAPPGAA